MFTHLKYLSSLFFPCCVAWFLLTGVHGTAEALLWTLPLWFLILVDWLSPKIDPNQQKHLVADWFYDSLLYTLSLLQFLIIGLLLIYANQLQWGSVNQVANSIVNLAVMRILVGTTSGSSAIIVAHELIHRNQKHKRILGRLLLYSVCYEHFVIAHIRGHHLNVATPEDIATARLGENFNHYWKRVYKEHFKYAWNFELNRLHQIHSSNLFANSVLQGLLIEATLVILIISTFGWAAAFIFSYQSLSAVRLLETINYYQHWGLEHGKATNSLAWVNQSSFTEYALIGLSNHISHHQNASSPFYNTPYSELGPKMPYGYFVTNLWVKLNNESYQRVSTAILKEPVL